MKIKKLITKVMNMFTASEILAAAGVKSALTATSAAQIERWRQMYCTKSALNLPSAISSETARLVTLEMRCKVLGSERAKFLNESLKKSLPHLRNAVEYACAMGSVVMRPYVSGKGIEVDFVRPDSFVPTEFDSSGKLIGAAFLDRRHFGGKVYTRIENHKREGDGYTVTNSVFLSDSEAFIGKKVPLATVDDWADIAPTVHIESLSEPLFAYFKMPMANGENAALGTSVFAKAESLISDAEEQYERLIWEFESAKRAVIADETAFHLSKDGKRALPDDRLYVTVNQENLFNEWSPALREEGFIRGLNEILRRIEFSCALAYGTLSNVTQCDKTAEEVRSSKQRSYSHVADIQGALRSSLEALLRAEDALCSLYSLAPKGDWQFEAEFDDSIVADRKREFDEKIELVREGVMGKEEFRNWYFGG